MLFPKRTKYNKAHKGRARGTSKNVISFGDFALMVKLPGRLKSNQIESARKAIRKSINRAGKLWIRVFPDIPVTKKPAEVRMGKGKGSVDHWVARVKKNQIIFELTGVNPKQAELAFKLASDKLPLKTKFLIKENITKD